jgi:NADPH2:quinone reductase
MSTLNITQLMKAAAINKWGDADSIELVQLPLPTLEVDDVLIKVAYAGVNPADWKMRAGHLADAFPNTSFPFVVGLDGAGIVVAIGKEVVGFSVGDRVVSGNNIFQSGKPGSYAEYMVVNQSRIASVPSSITLASAATLPIAGVTAWQALFAEDKGGLQQAPEKGEAKKVLINGASGGMGSFAVQLAKWAGAEVATTCSDRNLDYVKSLGADLLIDYKNQNIADELANWAPQGVDLIIDGISAGSLADPISLLRLGGKLVNIATLTDDGNIEADIADAESRGRTKILAFMSDNSLGEDMKKMIKLAESGQLKFPAIDTFALEDVVQAHHKLETGHVRGKLVLRVAGE